LIGEQLEKLGWRQGSVVKKQDMPDLLAFIGEDGISSDAHLIVASQSCDIANNNTENDPNVELLIARPIIRKDGNLTYNKNPRQLHSELKIFTGNTDLFSYESIEIKIAERILVPKEHLANFSPDDSAQLEAGQLESCVNWLSARYNRPALPTIFNNRIAHADPNAKLRKKAKALNDKLSGIYVEIIPFDELPEGENYTVNLLGLVTEINESEIPRAESSIAAIADILMAANMEVKTAVRSEADISVAQIKRFKRFYFDDLSFKDDTDLPPEVTTNL
jgi:hypothetical protein